MSPWASKRLDSSSSSAALFLKNLGPMYFAAITPTPTTATRTVRPPRIFLFTRLAIIHRLPIPVQDRRSKDTHTRRTDQTRARARSPLCHLVPVGQAALDFRQRRPQQVVERGERLLLSEDLLRLGAAGLAAGLGHQLDLGEVPVPLQQVGQLRADGDV